MGACHSVAPGADFDVSCTVDCNLNDDTPEAEVLDVHLRAFTLTAITPDSIDARTSITIEDRCGLPMLVSARSAGVELQASLAHTYDANTPLPATLKVGRMIHHSTCLRSRNIIAGSVALASGVALVMSSCLSLEGCAFSPSACIYQ
jgi:hypothetical protein